MTPFPTDQAQQLLAYLQAWRQYLEQSLGVMTPSQPLPPAPWGMPAAPPAAPSPAAASVPVANPPIPPTADYTQQLLAYLQAWRQYLEQAMGAAAPGQPYPTIPPPAVTAWLPAVPASQLAPTMPPPVVTTPPQPPRPIPPTPPTSQQPQNLETVLPHNFMAAQIARPPGFKPPDDEPSSVHVSLYSPSFSLLPSEVGEYQPNSAYGPPSASSGTPSPAAPESLYSGPPAPSTAATRKETHWGQKGQAAGNKPEELEIVRPPKDAGR
jgi:hypothetical protein